MHATQARSITELTRTRQKTRAEEAAKRSLNVIFKLITKAALRGERTVTLTGWNIEDIRVSLPYSTEIAKLLRDCGYSVTPQTANGANQLFVSW